MSDRDSNWGRLSLSLSLVAATACASPTAARPAPAAATASMPDPASIAAFVRVEDDALDWMAAADPRLALRSGVSAPEALLEKVGMEAVLAEDATAQVHAGSLDLFAFAGRTRALKHARDHVDGFHELLPEVGPPGAPLARPRLERDLLLRAIDEELARSADEAAMGDSAGDLVRAVVATWIPPKQPQDLRDRDALTSKHLLEIGASVIGAARTGPTDLDLALYPLERLLAPLVFPNAAAAIARLRVSLDADTRPNPPLATSDRIARLVRTHLGLAVDTSSLKGRLESTAARLRTLATEALDAAGAARPAMESRARDLLFVAGSCPEVPGTRIRNMVPSSERAPICGAVAALADEASRSAAIVALHDDVVLALAAVTMSPPPRTMLLSHPEDDVVDACRRSARERPGVALGVALAAELLSTGDKFAERAAAWRDFGDAPLDVVAAELPP